VEGEWWESGERAELVGLKVEHLRLVRREGGESGESGGRAEGEWRG
jgi:hypothetical protein